ncbi:hypothetical protein ISF_07276 [Cordyceps fumosorosea ARSEF 2679]|uniref:Uncharacterized protein n=1 Tax=Cordyceps fumosorosea (strain ARSEF 2679) TaxID=1081104 RepID=A0A167PKR6_CORFA|nr:hypothetical protein ISF_07276 [Cordyceps fumosorosea ARSEF 2679]OAA56760.1 hypothetical protein ISF_07276 [Cordyceps fumosorosea ARSEF 2679]
MHAVLIAPTLLGLVGLCHGTPSFHESKEAGSPQFYSTPYGLQIVAPRTPYVAVSGTNKLYYIDTRFNTDTASHIKEQVEWAAAPRPGSYIAIDDVAATASVKDVSTNETLFDFNPAYARVLFASILNKNNPSLALPVHEPAGDWEVTYGEGAQSLTERADHCSKYGCHTDGDCTRQSQHLCGKCHHARVDNECQVGHVNAIGLCAGGCSKAIDTPRIKGESDSSYYQRMDKLHFGA